MKNITRREFIKDLSLGAAAVGLSSSCASNSSRESTKESSGIQGDMEFRKNPANGDSVSLLGYGCMRWPMIKDDQGKEIVDQNKVNELVDKALEHGVNYYDTSPAYLQGESEKASGLALSRHPRKLYYLATKLSNFSNYSRQASLKMYYDSFEEMQTDWFDYYLLHSIGRGGMKKFSDRYLDNGIMDFLLKEREKGKIRQLGFSFHGPKDAFGDFMKLHERYHWDFVQIQMNYVDWRHADGKRNVNAEYLYDELDSRNIPITVMEPLQGGRLASVPEAIARELKEHEPSLSIPSWAFRFVGTYPRVLTSLSGMTYKDHLEDNLKTYCNFQPLTNEELEFLEEMAIRMHDYPTIGCNDCKYCMPCPYGIDIPGIFRSYNESINDGTFAHSKEQKEYLRLKREFLVRYNRSVETIRQANHCIGCSRCVEHCPQGLDIPRELRKIDIYVEKLKKDTL